MTQLDVLKIGTIKADDVEDLSNLLGCLRFLIIEDYPDTKTLSNLAKHCTQLDKLSLEDHDNKSFRKDFYSTWNVAYFPKLTYLDIFKGSCQSHFLQHLDKRYNDQLQVLKIPCITLDSKKLERVCKLRALRSLFCAKIANSSVDALAQMQLEHLNFWESGSLSKEDLLRFVRKCKTLKILESCLDLDIEFINNMIKIVEDKGFQPDHPFVLRNTSWCGKDTIKDLLVQVSFQNPLILISLFN